MLTRDDDAEPTRPHLMTEKDFAALSGLKVGTLRNWRCKRFGPMWRKLGGAVRYGPEALEWLDLQTRQSAV